MTRIGWLGLGKMGAPMARRLAAAGHAVTGYDPAGTAAGLPGAVSPEALAEGAQVLISMVPDDAALLDVAQRVAGRMAPGAAFIDMSTISPQASARAADHLGAADYLRAPVSGSTGLAEAGTLTILVSGPEAAFRAQRPLLDILGRKVVWLGPGDEARVAKLVINTLIAAINTALAEALNLGARAGLDWEPMIDLIAGSAAASPYVASKAEKLKRRDWTPAATVALLAKDLDLALDLGRVHHAALPLAALSRQMITRLEAQGAQGRDLASVLTLYEEDGP